MNYFVFFERDLILNKDFSPLSQKDFEFFKEDNNKWKENISKGLASEEDYIKWLSEQ